MTATSPFESNTVVIKTEVFAGPLDLLLTLIERRKLFINDISLSKVTDDYLCYVREREVFPMAEGAYFILTASTLMLIKSRSLLPELDLTEEEEEDINDLEKRLAVYKLVKEVGEEIGSLFNSTPAYARSVKALRPVIFAPDQDTDLLNLKVSLEEFLVRENEAVADIPQAKVKTTVKLEEVLKKLSQRIHSRLSLSFKEFTGHRRGAPIGQEERVSTVVTFIAMLELVRQGLVEAVERDDDIYMEVATVDVPVYDQK